MQRIDIGALIDGRRIGRFHIGLLAMSYLLLITEGFDLGAAGFAAPGIAREWHLSGSDLGLLFSTSIAAGFFGPPLFGFLADRYGRKRVIIAGTICFGILTLLSVVATTFLELVGMRILTGVALAGTLPIVVTLNNEFAPARFRATAVMLVFTGVTFGGALPGLVAANLAGPEHWRTLFWIGGAIPLAVAGLLVVALPESAKFLTLRPHRRPELVAILRRLAPGFDAPADAIYTLLDEDERRRFSLKALLAGRLALLTPLFWISNFIAVTGVYSMNQWLPTVLAAGGVPTSDAALATTLFQLGGTIGSLLLMRILDRVGFLPVPFLFALAVPLLVLVGHHGLSVAMLFVIIFGVGFCIQGAQLANIGTEGNIYPTAVRSSGVGSNFAVGRVGGGLGPLVGGFAMSASVPVPQIFAALAALFACGCVATAIAIPFYRRHLGETALATAQTSLSLR